MKKLLASVLALVMLLGLCACGSNNDDGPSSNPAPDVSDSQGVNTDPAPGPVADPGDITSWILEENPESITGTVRFWIPFNGNQGMDAMIAAFNEVYPNITVELNTYNNNADGNLAVNAAIMAEQVDVLASFGIHNAYRRWENNMYQDLTGKLQEEGIDLVANWGSDVYKYENRVYTLPCGGRSIFVAINMDSWEEAGLGEIPTEWTWDEYMAACEAMTKRDANGSVTVYGGSDYQNISFYTYAYSQVTGGSPYYNEEGLSSFNDEIVVNALSRKIKAELEDEVWFPAATYRSDNIQAQQTYSTGQIASTINTNLIRFIRDTENYPMAWKTAFAPYPVEEKGQTNYMGGVGHFSHAGITMGCKDQDAAWAFLKWYSTYGSKYLIIAGHQSAWKGTDLEDLVTLVFGSLEAAEELIDVDSFYHAVVNYESPVFSETVLTAYTEVEAAINAAATAAIYGEMDPAAASAWAQEEADAAILAELG